ncbi:MAG: 2-dehydro-3-deoxygalactonokinase [Pseudomonadota bacterium]
MLIAVDWGTTQLRAFLMDGSGSVIDTIAAKKGLMAVEGGRFEAALKSVIGPWLEAERHPILMSGMVGSRQGWVEAPYVGLPATLEDLALNAVAVDGQSLGEIAIIPGLATAAPPPGFADVMRGEETQIFGAAAALGLTSGRFVLPGTHSKWATLDEGKIAAFTTAMTGDLFGAIAGHTILSKTMTEDDDPAAFDSGLEAAAELAMPGDLLARLFSIRAETLFDRLKPFQTRSFLSGLLIGCEVAANASDRSAVTIVGGATLSSAYAHALGRFGIPATTAPDTATAMGLFAVARARSLL